jgi:hypothetical protein
MNTKDRERLERFRDQVSVPLANTDPDKWPIRAGRIGHIILDVFSQEFFEQVGQLRLKETPIGEISRLFKNPTRLWRMSHHLLKGLQMAKLPREEQRKNMLILLDMIKSLKHGSEFMEKGRNIILPPQEAESMAKGMTPTDNKTSRMVHQLAASLWGYSETLYFVAHEISVEIHGPYTLDNGMTALVRDYRNLKPNDLWSECNTLSFDNLRITAAYKDLEMEFDVYNNPYLKKNSFMESCQEYRMEVNGIQTHIQEIPRMTKELSQITTAIVKKVDNYSLPETGKKYAEIFWYRKKPLADALGVDWKPPEIVYKRFESTPIAPEVTKPTGITKIKENLDITK